MTVFTHNNIYKVSIFFAIVSFISVFVLINNYFEFREALTTPIQDKALQGTLQLAQKIDGMLRQSVPLASDFVADLRDMPLNEPTLIKRLKRLLNTNPDLLGVGVAFEPFSYDSDVRLFAPYLMRHEGALKRIQIENRTDYTVSEYKWYRNPLEKGALWNHPRFSQAADRRVVEYAVPFFRVDPETGKTKKSGVVFLHYPLEDILGKLSVLYTGQAGYAILLSQEGTILSHPIKTYVEEGQNILQVAGETGNPLLEAVGQRVLTGKRGIIEGFSHLTGQESWVNIEQIPATGWTIAVFHGKEDLTRGNRLLRRHLIRITVVSIVFFVSLIMIDLSRRKKRGNVTLCLRALFVSMIFTAGIGLIWFFATDDLAWKNLERTVILNPSDLESFRMKNIKTALRNRQPLPIYIPTGVFVQSIEFTSANNVILTGYVWQRYNHHVPDDLSRGFILPEAESASIVEAYRRKEKNAEVIGWYFHVTLRQEFDYTRYPFDQQTIWMRLWHQDFDKNVILLPALDSYDLIHPERLPGIEQDFVLPGWTVSSSFFNYRFNSYNTDFGIDRYVGQNRFPELYFQIGVKRRFLNPFISNLTPVIVVLLMLFAVLITSSKESDKTRLLGFTASTILASSSALFFVVLVSHIDVRGSLAANEIFYMEYFYVVTYGTILAVSINSILFSWGMNIPFIQYRDNLLPKLVYWPVITLIMLLVTLAKFY